MLLVEVFDLELVLIRENRKDELQIVAELGLVDFAADHVDPSLPFLFLLRLLLGLCLVAPILLCAGDAALLSGSLLLDLLELRSTLSLAFLALGLRPGMCWLDHESLSHPCSSLFVILPLSLHAEAEALHTVNEQTALDLLVQP